MLIESYSQKVKGKIKTYEKIKVPEAESEISFSIDTGIGYMKVTNKSNKWFATTVSMKKMSGLKVIKPDKVPYRFDMHPQTSVVIGFFVSEKGYSY